MVYSSNEFCAFRKKEISIYYKSRYDICHKLVTQRHEITKNPFASLNFNYFYILIIFLQNV